MNYFGGDYWVTDYFAGGYWTGEGVSVIVPSVPGCEAKIMRAHNQAIIRAARNDATMLPARNQAEMKET